MFSDKVELFPEEQSKIDAFKEWLQTKKITLPNGYDDRTIFRYNMWNDKNHAKTLKQITDHYEWYLRVFPVYEDLYSKYVNKGVMYIYKRDRA